MTKLYTAANSLFIDSSAFIALRDEKDVNHRKAQNFLQNIRERRIALVTTNFIFDEVYTYFCKSHRVAVEMGEYIRNNPVVIYYRITPDDEAHAWETAKAYKAKPFRSPTAPVLPCANVLESKTYSPLMNILSSTGNFTSYLEEPSA